MDFFALFVPFFSIWACSYFLTSRRRRSGKLPPGPYPFPIIGNILQVGQKPYQSLAKLSRTYGSLMSIQLGSVHAVVVSSPEIAKEILLKHGQEFSSRATPVAAHAHDHHKVSMGFLPVGPEWRKLRKIAKEMFSTNSLEASQGLRQDKLQKLCDYVTKCCDSGIGVNISEAAFITTMNLMSATLFSAEFCKFDSDVTHEFEEIFSGLINLVGVPNIADYFPVLKPVDPQGIRQKSKYYFGKLLVFIEDIINERLQSRSTSTTKKNDLLETLLNLGEGSEYDFSMKDIKHLLLDLFVGGTDSTTTSIEWTMTELLLNPDKLSKVKQELKTVVGENKIVQESDILKLPYFQAVIKETLRYHPPGPLLLPRESICDVEINGYIIPKGTQILFNVWAIGRDSSLWSNPESFEPERFLGRKIDFKGQDFELIPFGSGRRICPGIPLANRMLHITVATLIHRFDWKLESGIKHEVDGKMMGAMLRRKVPLKAIPSEAN